MSTNRLYMTKGTILVLDELDLASSENGPVESPDPAFDDWVYISSLPNYDDMLMSADWDNMTRN